MIWSCASFHAVLLSIFLDDVQATTHETVLHLPLDIFLRNQAHFSALFSCRLIAGKANVFVFVGMPCATGGDRQRR